MSLPVLLMSLESSIELESPHPADPTCSEWMYSFMQHFTYLDLVLIVS